MRAARESETGASASEIGAEIRLAASFLTIAPVISDGPMPDSAVAASFGWFPLVGFILGLALAFEDLILGYLFGYALRSILVIASLTIITGAVHLDGLADTADALGAGRNRERALAILRDSRIGSYGAAAIFLDLALKAVALASIAGTARYVAIFAAVGLARWTMVAAADRIPYLRSQGAGTALLPRADADASPNNLMLATLTAAGAMLPLLSRKIIGAIVIVLLIVAGARAFYRRWLGGVTGDLIGACGELTEVAVLLVFAA